MKTVPKHIVVGISDWIKRRKKTLGDVRVIRGAGAVCKPERDWVRDQLVEERVDMDEANFDSV
jgi:hypothetical protein